jgi:hypothetical protein
MTIQLPAFGPDLPVHPFTGLTALGLRRNGAPIWPVRGGAEDGDAAADDGGDSAGDAPEDLGDAGKQAIDRMKAERNAARNELRQVKEQLDKLSPLQKLADALGGQSSGDAPTDLESLTERLSRHESELAAERLARHRVEVAAEKGLTPAQAKRLVGKSRDELAADADEIIRDFPAAAAGTNRPAGLRPDPSQGSRGEKATSGRDAGLAEAQKRFGKASTAT